MPRLYLLLRLLYTSIVQSGIGHLRLYLVKGSANLLLDEIGDPSSVSRTGEVCDKNMSSHIRHPMEPCLAL